MKLIDVLKITEPSTVIKLHNKDLLNFATVTAGLLLNGYGFDLYHGCEVLGINPGYALDEKSWLSNSVLFITINY